MRGNFQCYTFLIIITPPPSKIPLNNFDSFNSRFAACYNDTIQRSPVQTHRPVCQSKQRREKNERTKKARQPAS